MLLQVSRIRAELDHWLDHWQTEIKAETCPRHLDCARLVSQLLLEKMVRIQGYETQETRAYETRIELLDRAGKAMWEPPPNRSERPSLRIVR